MKKQIILFLLSFLSVHLNAQNLNWVKGIGSTGLDQGRTVASDAAGNMYLTGNFSATVDFDPGAGIFNLTAFGQYDGFVLKLDPLGNFMWAKQFGGVNEEFSENIAVDNTGNVIIGGHYIGTADFNPGPSTFNLTSNGSEDIFILKLDPSGSFLWAKSIGGVNSDQNFAVEVDPSGNVYAVGVFTFTVDFDPGAGNFNLNFSNGNGYIFKLDASGNFSWAKQIKAGVEDIHIDAAGNIYLTGNFGGTVDFDLGAGVFNLTASASDMYVTKLNSAGNFTWAKKMGGNLSIESISICTDLNGNIYTTGRFEGTVDFNPGAATNNITSNGEWDAFISKLDASGNFVWVDKIGGANWEYAFGVDVDASGNVYIGGAFQDVVDFDPGAGITSLTSFGLVNAYTLKLNSSGNLLWVVPFNSFDQIYSYAIAANDDGTCYVAGDFSSSADFNPAPGFQFISPVGGADAYICKLGTCASLPATGNISGNNNACAGTIATYSITPVAGATNYNWSVPSGSSINSGQNTNSITVFIGNNAGNIVVTPSNACTNGSTATLPISINPLPTPSSITANGNTTFCAGNTVTLNGNAGGTWNTGATTSSITVSNPGVYFVTNSNACGSVNSNQINISVLQPPSASNISANGNTTFCAGNSVVLSGNVGGTWINGSSNASITVTTSGTYFVTNSNSCGSVTSNQINVTVNPLPIASSIAANGNTTFCVGNSVTLNGNTGGTWNTGANSASITVSNPGVYFVTNTNVCGSVNSNQINVTVNPLPTPVTISPGGLTTFCNGNFVVLFGNTNGTWNTGASTTSINVVSSGDYFVTNSNSCGSSNSNIITVTVENAPTAAIIQASGNTEFCSGDSVELNGNNNGIWNNGFTTSSIIINNSGDYFVTNTNSCGSATSNHIIVNVWPMPPAPIITQVGNTLEATTGFPAYQWYLNNSIIAGETQVAITPTNIGNYTVDAIDTNGCIVTSQEFNFVIQALNPLSNSEIIIYPNPASTVLNIVLDVSKMNTQIEISNVQGEIILSQKNNLSLNQFNIENIANGIYFVRIGNEVRKFVKLN